MCIAADAEGKVYTSGNLEVPSTSPSTTTNSDTNTTTAAYSCEPRNVQQVFVITAASFDNLTDNSSEPDATGSLQKKIALKTSSGGYLTADKLGILSARATAVGPQQTFTLTVMETGFWSIETVWGKFVAIEKEKVNSNSSSSSKVNLGPALVARADADEVGYSQSFV